MSGIIKTIKAKDEHDVQHNIFPKTVLEAVVDSETNETLDIILADKVSKTDIVDNLESTATNLPLSANQGRIVNENIGNMETALMTGINVTGQDFNELDYGSFIGIGTNMTNAPHTNSSVSYLIQQICVRERILQYAKAVNWGDGELLWFRQMRIIAGDGDGAQYWDNWHQVGLQSDINTLKSQTRKCITYVQRDATDKIYISATFHGCDKQIIVLKGSNNSAQTIFTLVHFCSFLPNSIQLTNWGAQLEVVENSVYYAKDTVQDVTELKFALSGINQWAGIDIEFPVKTASMSASSSEI